MLPAFIVMTILSVILGTYAYKKDPTLLLESARSGGFLFIKLLPIMILAMFLAGLMENIFPRDAIARYVGRESGWTGLLIGTVMGILTPGGPFVQFPIVASLFRAGADIGPVVAYLSAWSLLGLNRVIALEVPLLGIHVVGIRFLSSLVFPPIIGLIARWLWLVLRFSLKT
ncbi:permease [Thermodesulforhabdus norvegica]|uniref:Predicted permease n=1 Tax=Thermodesulforhabdus norvegica TaxID=39841 RepID=A0A1I4RM72_9BACT|nr:permease [Thermodesulforhabdus norvegica]SFM53312.1 Predicted permease [Thermodesulforhabdus norvegica]